MVYLNYATLADLERLGLIGSLVKQGSVTLRCHGARAQESMPFDAFRDRLLASIRERSRQPLSADPARSTRPQG